MSDSNDQWPQYQCHKIVGALKIKDTLKTGRNDAGEFTTRISFYLDRYEPIVVAPNFILRYQPKKDGYLILHENGTYSYCSSMEFEQDYKEIEESVKVVKEQQIKGIRIYPVLTTRSKDYFVHTSLIQPRSIKAIEQPQGESIPCDEFLTSAIRIDCKYSLLGLSQSENFLNIGACDQTDSLHPSVFVDKLYLGFMKNGITTVISSDYKLIRESIPNAGEFVVDNNWGNIRVIRIEESFIFAHPEKFNGCEVQYRINIHGSINLELGDAQLKGDIEFARLLDHSASAYVPTAAGQISYALGEPTILGYDLEAYRVNYNRQSR